MTKQKMMVVFLLLCMQVGASCKKDKSEGNGESQKGYVTGVVRDGSGNPLKGVRIIIDNSIFFNSKILTETDASGKYKVKVPNGAWYAFAQYEKTFNGKTYTFYLHPDNHSGFDGDGAVRNFEWKLTGVMRPPLSGSYGGLLTFDNYPGQFVEDAKKIVFQLRPIGRLIDGSEGSTLMISSDDGFQLPGIPVGVYEVTAHYEGVPLKLRKWNSDDAFAEVFSMSFEPQIAAQCDNCAKLEYSK